MDERDLDISQCIFLHILVEVDPTLIYIFALIMVANVLFSCLEIVTDSNMTKLIEQN